MSVEGYLLIIPLAVSLCIGLFLICRGDKAYQALNKAFSLWVLGNAFWYAQWILETVNMDMNRALFLFRLPLIVQLMIPSLFLYFILRFVNDRMTIPRMLFLWVPAILFGVLVIFDFMGSDLIIATLRLNNYGENTYGVVYRLPAFLIWLVYFVWYSVWGAGVLLAHVVRTAVVFHDASFRNLVAQRTFLLASLSLLAFILGLTLDIIIPIVYTRVFPVSSITTVFMVGFMGRLLVCVER
ncbi:MAG: histidine kinase N-terminal 7TM domain-containing protein [Candidatus Auribacterota bacterium]|jgi:hypothetical protein|uniref:Histidine kinase N-terminal 7TM region domain-containing protein n=1 Tax=Candidatus Auribacter fodinae TaxID=2093366 RepID=A0A3A4R9I0_9BACT|nr:MAG: hypothetical protein C4541_00930 [Candidatus Auribacter fodinae]